MGRYGESPVALCPEGFVHYAIDGQWLLYVPWFQGPRNLPVLKLESQESVVAAIQDDNTIITPRGRRVGPREWYH